MVSASFANSVTQIHTQMLELKCSESYFRIPKMSKAECVGHVHFVVLSLHNGMKQWLHELPLTFQRYSRTCVLVHAHKLYS